MIYNVTAKLIQHRTKELYVLLISGKLPEQQQDGQEIVASMERARIDVNGVIHWSETCFCPIPLLHEIETVYNRYFLDLTTELVMNHQKFEGIPLLVFLKETFEQPFVSEK
jgi:hypothetical protein